MTIWVLMGVAGSGKSAVGREVAERLDVDFVEGDDFHDARAIERMRAGRGLDDVERTAWAGRLAAALGARGRSDCVVACSALTGAVRARLEADVAAPLVYLHLVAPRAVVERRLRERSGHFAGPELLDQQFAALDAPPHAMAIDADGPFEIVVERAIRAIERLRAAGR